MYLQTQRHSTPNNGIDVRRGFCALFRRLYAFVAAFDAQLLPPRAFFVALSQQTLPHRGQRQFLLVFFPDEQLLGVYGFGDRG
jgi:hypothetical protein